MTCGELPEDCTSNLASDDARECAVSYYNDEENNPVVRASSAVIGQSIADHWPRVREIVSFAREAKAERIGIASCVSFLTETKLLAEILRAEGFEVVDAMCRIGSIRRVEAGACGEDEARADAVTCNPYMQADVLNQSGTDINIIMGLCIGHDMIFTRQSHAWVTTLAIKDQSRTHDEIIGDQLRRYQAIERLRQDLYDAAILESMGGCGSQLVAAQGVMGASEQQLLERARKEGFALSRYGL